MTDRPAAPSRSARRASAPPKIPAAAPPVSRMLPYAAGALIVGGLALALRTPAVAPYGALGAGAVAFALMSWLALSHRVSLEPRDGLRGAVLALSVAVFAAAFVPFALTVMPPPPAATLRLDGTGAEATARLTGPVNSVWLTLHAALEPRGTGAANYFVSVRRDGGAAERLNGALRVQPDRSVRDRVELAARGAGSYTVRLDESSPSIRMPLEASLTVRWFNTALLAMVYAALAFGVIGVDALLARRGQEPSFAAALLLPLGAVLYFQRRPPGDALLTELAGAGAVGIAAALGGELLARIGRMLAPRSS